jgi:hypothetical protein
MPLEKVQILKWNGSTWANVFGDDAPDHAARFNPDKLQLGKKSTWKTEKVPGANIGITTFGGGDPMTLSIDLFFDTSKTGTDVRQYTGALLELTMAPVETAANMTSLYQLQKQLEEQAEGTGAPIAAQMSAIESQPPKCKFLWGRFTSFEAYVESVNTTFTMFLQDGTPVRARAKVKLKQIEDIGMYPPQNPTTRSAARKTWVVREGQRLDWIAYQEYGDPALWRYLARANNLDDPRDLRPGQILDLTLVP